MSDPEYRERLIAVNKSLHKKYIAARQASCGVKNAYAEKIARELHYKMFYTDNKPDISEDIILVPHPILKQVIREFKPPLI